jgi:hypothetical protein
MRMQQSHADSCDAPRVCFRSGCATLCRVEPLERSLFSKIAHGTTSSGRGDGNWLRGRIIVGLAGFKRRQFDERRRRNASPRNKPISAKVKLFAFFDRSR